MKHFERDRQEDIDRWKLKREFKQQLPTMSMTAKRLKHIDFHDYSEEEHF
jgi:hypothetical protein